MDIHHTRHPPHRTSTTPDIHHTTIYIFQKCTFPNPVPEGHTEILQLTFILQLLAWYIQYQHTYSTDCGGCPILHMVWWMSGVVDVWCGGCLVWWMSGVVDVWCGGCPILHMVWWMSGVVDVWCGGCLVWWMSVWWMSYNPFKPRFNSICFFNFSSSFSSFVNCNLNLPLLPINLQFSPHQWEAYIGCTKWHFIVMMMLHKPRNIHIFPQIDINNAMYWNWQVDILRRNKQCRNNP